MLTAVLALSTAVLVVVMITLAALLITAAAPAATSSSEGGGSNPGAVVWGTSENYGEGWNNYGHDITPPKPAQAGNGGDAAIDRHAEGVAADN